MTSNDPAMLAQVDQGLAEFSGAVDRYASQLTDAIEELGYEAAVVNFWRWLEQQPDGPRGWLAAVAFAKLARQHLDSGMPPGGRPARRKRRTTAGALASAVVRVVAGRRPPG